MKNKSLRLLLSALLLSTLATAPREASAEEIPAQIHCYTEQIDLPIKSVVLKSNDDPTVLRFFDYVGSIGGARLRLAISVRDTEEGLFLRYAQLSMIVKPNVTFGSGGIATYGEDDEMPLPRSNRIVVGIGHNYLMPYDFDEGNLSCEVQLLPPVSNRN
ncbi:MAG: hypothetical protein J0M12_12490 [Deltaproteobacteria bacterium]|nr:hypothetical protein [Deltaproteobacteria bacterium]